MSRYHSYTNAAARLIQEYLPGKPFSLHIRSYFAANKKYGSRDRRIITSLCYAYFRAGKAFPGSTMEEKLILSLFLCENKSNELIHFFDPGLNEKITANILEKLDLLKLKAIDFFSFAAGLSKETDAAQFSLSMLKQPDLFLRCRPGKAQLVKDKLSKAGTPFKEEESGCLRIANNSPVDKILLLNREAVVQDYNSQKVLDYLEEIPAGYFETVVNAWDCCAASGGKSILLWDKLSGKVNITVSDIRENILSNLRVRFREAGVKAAGNFVADLAVVQKATQKKYNIIICDAPCTGSGTWGRTPEQLFYFDERGVDVYAERQRKIISNIVPGLDNNALLFYITCSVFEKENESVVSFIASQLRDAGRDFQLKEMKYLKGYESSADTMFVAVFSVV